MARDSNPRLFQSSSNNDICLQDQPLKLFDCIRSIKAGDLEFEILDCSPQQEIYLYWLGGVRSNGSCFLRDAAAAPVAVEAATAGVRG